MAHSATSFFEFNVGWKRDVMTGKPAAERLVIACWLRLHFMPQLIDFVGAATCFPEDRWFKSFQLHRMPIVHAGGKIAPHAAPVRQDARKFSLFLWRPEAITFPISSTAFLAVI
ncbi:hypothetical protein [Rhizobium bangladeshense]|uniref:hypothetical protein n=1 Tax=Rhizobium bangladeshense TaxID=1138189 RepID=UPI001C82C9F8|nr:hypothetical protein [Rhizobium bangladeshense]